MDLRSSSQPSRQIIPWFDLTLRTVTPIFFSLVFLSGRAPAADRKIDFNRDVRPILSNKCFRCHGPDENERKAGLRLDLHESATKPSESGAVAIVPSDPSSSELLKRIESKDLSVRMPPEGFDPLSENEIGLMKRWIEQGASWRGHWSFEPVARTPVGIARGKGSVVAPIDFFIHKRLDEAGLAPSGRADRVTLIRRITQDLTGLPPTLAEVDSFVNDRSADAYEKVVDRLLASPKYGEHMARFWLDAARYGDTHGLHLDNERSMWKYREWVIQAFNDNKPFDEFTVEQLAGDLLPSPTVEQQIATGFNRCNVTTGEGGSIDEEVLVRYAVDRVETTSTVWLGLTAGCAVCHDHKYDPISQREFYQLYAFFRSTADAAMDGNQLAPPPILKIPTSDQASLFAKLAEENSSVSKRIVERLAGIEYVDPTPDDKTILEPAEYVWFDEEIPKGAKPTRPFAWTDSPSEPMYSGARALKLKASGIEQFVFENADPRLKVGEGDRFFAYVYIDPKDVPDEIMLQFNDGVWDHRVFWGKDAIDWGAVGTPSRFPGGALPAAGQWVRLEVEAKSVGLAAGAEVHGWAFTQSGGTCFWDRAGIVTRTPQAGQGFASLAVWESLAPTLPGLPQPVKDAATKPTAERSEADRKQLRDYFIEHVCTLTAPKFEDLHQARKDLAKRKEETEKAIPVTMVMAELPQKRDAFVLVRGAYDKPSVQVFADTPKALHPFPEAASRDRLGLAKWLVDPANPLTARVIVNRYWQQFFGRGLVKTAEDFGSQGQLPTHPELLDWLANEFVSHGWNVKHMIKTIALSETYQQSSKSTSEQMARDPQNELYGRGPRFRLDAEGIRDAALFASGLLVDRIGGRSVKPYQPEGLWEAVGFFGSDTREFKQDHGEALFRRGLYVFWKRTSPPPSLLATDAPSRETCTVRRARTNTPLQALALMNDIQYVEAASRLAQRMMREGSASPEGKLGYGFRLVASRYPEPNEFASLKRLFDTQRAAFEAHPEEATKLLSVGESPRDTSLDPVEHAAWTMVANVILNLDEAITKE